MIGSKFSRHFFNQLEENQSQSWLRVITSIFDWFTGLSPDWPKLAPFSGLAKVITLVLVLRHSIETRSKPNLPRLHGQNTKEMLLYSEACWSH